MLITAETVTTVSSLPEIRDYEAVAIGPGLSQDKDCLETLAILLISTQKPLIIDADALNLIAANPHLLIHLPVNSILTPHAKELERLVGASENRTQEIEKTLEFAQKYQVIMILKGANTAICLPNGEVYFNSTGNAGMATGGSGDVLTGVLLSLLAQGYASKDAAIVGVYKHGEAGDVVAAEKGQSALLARDIVDKLRIT
jgi:NAD(P)H-hydrate epimerase